MILVVLIQPDPLFSEQCSIRSNIFHPAFTAFANAWPRAIKTEIGAALCAVGRGKGLNSATLYCVNAS